MTVWYVVYWWKCDFIEILDMGVKDLRFRNFGRFEIGIWHDRFKILGLGILDLACEIWFGICPSLAGSKGLAAPSVPRDFCNVRGPEFSGFHVIRTLRVTHCTRFVCLSPARNNLQSHKV